ncbi:NAD-dependent epimerase/dehydratase family protein [bacterium]|nr:NAD-dependent epimerase/dehydratase family protein [bacterium]
MKIFVTGGGGFLGLAIVEQLVEEGYEVVTYSRGKYEALEKLGVVHHQGNLSDYKKLKDALQGCEAVFHVAAKVSISGSYDSFYKVNVAGTQHILKACLELNIPHLVYTSSPSVVFDGGSEGKDEGLPYPQKFDAYYPQTKAIAEQAVLKANCPSLVTCALRPHLIWGPRDHHFLPRFFERRRKDRLRILGSGNSLVDTIFVENAARAHLQALKVMQKNPAAVAGKAYFLSQDEPITIREFIDRLLATSGLPPVNKTLNPKVALFAGWLLQNVFRLFNIKSEPPLTLFVAKHLSSSHWYDISAAKRDFGYMPLVSIDEGMMRLKEWVEANGLVAP